MKKMSAFLLPLLLSSGAFACDMNQLMISAATSVVPDPFSSAYTTVNQVDLGEGKITIFVHYYPPSDGSGAIDSGSVENDFAIVSFDPNTCAMVSSGGTKCNQINDSSILNNPFVNLPQRAVDICAEKPSAGQ